MQKSSKVSKIGQANLCTLTFSFYFYWVFYQKYTKWTKKLGRVGRKLGSPKSVLLNFYPVVSGNSSKSIQNWAKNWAGSKNFLKFS